MLMQCLDSFTVENLLDFKWLEKLYCHWCVYLVQKEYLVWFLNILREKQI